MTARRFSLAACVERVRRAARRDDITAQHLNSDEVAAVLLDHPDVAELGEIAAMYPLEDR